MNGLTSKPKIIFINFSVLINETMVNFKLGNKTAEPSSMHAGCMLNELALREFS